MKTCDLPKCKKELPKGRKRYCCPEHSIIGASNRSLIMDAKQGARIFCCSTKGCNRVYIVSNEKKQCSKCRTGANGFCHKRGCKNKIDKSRTSRALFCSDEHAKEQRLEDLRSTRKKSMKAAHHCAAEGCHNEFIKASNAQKYCPGCQGSESTKKAKPGAFKNRPENSGVIVAGASFHDFRAKICKPNNIDCKYFSKCSDSLMEHKQGLFEYQKNGGVNCYKAPGASRPYMARNSMKVCSTKHLP